MRLSAAVAVVFAFATPCIAQDVRAFLVSTPTRQLMDLSDESLSGDMAHPDFARWTTEETIVSTVAAPELGGTLVSKRIKVLDDYRSPGFLAANDAAKREPVESHVRPGTKRGSLRGTGRQDVPYVGARRIGDVA